MKFGRQKQVLVESDRYERLFVQAESNKTLRKERGSEGANNKEKKIPLVFGKAQGNVRIAEKLKTS